LAGHVACMEAIRNAHKILVRKATSKRPLGIPSIDRRIISEWISGKLSGKV